MYSDMIGKLYTKVGGGKEWDFITIGYNALDTSVSVVLEQSGIVHGVVSDGAPNAIVKLNGNVVTAPFTIECGDVLSADFDPAPLKSNIIFEGYFDECTYNFDISADWSLLGVTDEATFIAWVEANSTYSVDTVSDFELSGNDLKCNIEATFSGGLGMVLNFLSQGITEVRAIGGGFTGIVSIDLNNNNLTEFNPVIALPVTLTFLNLNSNNITTAGWTISEAWANAQPSFTSNCDVLTQNNTDTVSGTTFETILISKNCTVYT